MEIQLFNFESKNVRVHLDELGNPWFIAKDVCEILELTNISMALANHKKDDITKIDDVDSRGRKVSLAAVNEPGLYRLIFKSEKENAENLKDFVFSKILPEIRKTGAFESKKTWTAARLEGKGVRKILTDTMKTFIEYAKKQGSQSADMYYTNFSKMVNSELIEFDKKPLNLRDHLNTSQLHRVSVAEQIIIQSIVECVAKQVHYKEVYKIAKEKIHIFASTVGKSKLGQSEKQTLLLEFSA